jgi:NNP family nitrate/nitrite transporter-like MFS transporter
MGVVCDKLGPRRGLAFLLLVTAPAIIGIAFVQDAASFIACRAIIGMSLASFVACQVWCTQMFSSSIVGVANATAGGWGNLGGGLTNLLMPFIFLGFMSATGGNEHLSWRLCFVVPFLLHIGAASLCFTSQDLPQGNYRDLERLGKKQTARADVVAKVGLSNVNAWILTLTYGLCFGVELTMTNIATLYFYEYHAMPQTLAAMLGSIFGLVNICARSIGGFTSDWCNRRWGIRGRLWALWAFQTLEGGLCIAMGVVTVGMRAPNLNAAQDVLGHVYLPLDDGSGGGGGGGGSGSGVWVPFGGGNSSISERIHPCGSMQVEISDVHRSGGLDLRLHGLSTVVLSEPPQPYGHGDLCVSNSRAIGAVVVIMFLFSVAVQMAEGLTYGIVPSISRPALGVVSGMVGAGGNAGSLLTNAAFFSSDSVRTDTGFVNMGIMIIVGTMTLFGCYFPEGGGMLFRRGALNYDPQLIAPPAGYKGADEVVGKTTTAASVAPSEANDKQHAEHYASGVRHGPQAANEL